VRTARFEIERPPGFERLCATLALIVPLVVTLFRAESGSDWRDDLPAVTGFAFLPLGGEGWLGLIVNQAAALLPVGDRWLRAASATALALSLASRLVYAAARALLARSEEARGLAPALALAAALTAVLSPTFQLEGTVIGGAALGALAALLTLHARAVLPVRDVRSSFVVGVLVALTGAESHAAVLSLGVALVARAAIRRELPTPAEFCAGLAGAGAVIALVVSALLLRGAAPTAWLDLGFGLGQSSLTTGDGGKEHLTALAAWLADVGLIPLGLSAFGFVTGLLGARTRRRLAPLLALVLVDLALPASQVGPLLADPFGPSRLLALAALGVGAALGVQAAALGLYRARVPFARPAAVLLVVFDFTLVLVGFEASAAASERRDSLANEVWTDEGLSGLPPNALFFARSEALAWRLWAAQLVRGERPDVVVVPSSMLERGALRRRLLAAEPALAPLLRDIALSGKPGEFALSTLADARPLFVELDASWDERLSEHIVPQSFWLRFRSNPVGRSDRTVAVSRAGRRFERVVSQVAPGQGRDGDAATRAVVVASLRQRALFLAGRRDHDTTASTLDQLERLAPRDEVASRLRGELAAHARKLAAAAR